MAEAGVRTYDKKDLLRHCRDALFRGNTPLLWCHPSMQALVEQDLTEAFPRYLLVNDTPTLLQNRYDGHDGFIIRDLSAHQWQQDIDFDDFMDIYIRAVFHRVFERDEPSPQAHCMPRIIITYRNPFRVWRAFDVNDDPEETETLKDCCRYFWQSTNLMFVGMERVIMTEDMEWANSHGGQVEIDWTVNNLPPALN